MRNVKKHWCKLTSVMLSCAVAVCSMLSFSSGTHAVQKTEIDFKDVKKTEANLNDMAEEVIWLVNEARAEENARIREENKERAARGEELLPEVKPLKAVPYLNDKARERSRETIFKFSHWRPRWDGQADGDDNLFITIVDRNLIPYSGAGENIAAGKDSAQKTFEQWKNSPGHWKAILNPNYTHIGVGCSYEPNDANHYYYYWTQLFITYDYDTYGPIEGEYVAERFQTVPKGPGDVNGDGEINSYDLVALNKYLAGELLLNDLQKESCDLLKDNVISAADATVLRKYILGEYKELPMTMDMLFK